MIRCRSILVTTVLTLSVVFSLFPEPRAAAGSKGLFTESRSTIQFRAQSNSRSLRSRHVKIDFDLLGDARGFRRAPQKGRQSLELNLFPDTSFTAVVDKIEPHPKGYSWIGQVQGVQDSIVILTVLDNVVAGNVTVSGTSYQIRHIEAGVHAIREVDPEAARPEGEPIHIGSEAEIPSPRTPAIARDEGGKFDGSPDRTPFLWPRAVAGRRRAATAGSRLHLGVAVVEMGASPTRWPPTRRFRLDRARSRLPVKR